MERSHIELSSARMFDAASLVEHMPHSVLGRLCLCGGLFHRAATLAMGRKGWSGTAAVWPSVSIMTCMTWPKTQGQQKHTNNAARLTDYTSCQCMCITGLCLIKPPCLSCCYTRNVTPGEVWVKEKCKRS